MHQNSDEINVIAADQYDSNKAKVSLNKAIHTILLLQFTHNKT